MRASVPCQTSALSLIGLLWENNRSMRLSYGMSIGEWGNGWEKRCAWFPWRERPEKGGVNSLLILVPVFFRNVVFRDFVGLDLHFVRVVRVLYTFDDVDRKSTRLNSSHSQISYAVFCLKKTTNRRPLTAEA